MIKFTSRMDLGGSRIDRENGIIKGISLISLGEARGHDKSVDEKTLQGVIKCASTYGDGLRIKFNPTTFQHGAGSLAGYVPPASLRIEDGKAIGDLHLYKAFPQEAMEYLYEIAERTPKNIGLSIEFSGDDEEIDGRKFARCTEIYGASIVDLPAANPTGFFSEGESNKPTKKDIPMDEETIKKLSTAIAGAVVAGLKPVIQTFAAANGDKEKEKEKEEMAAAGVTDEDSEETKKEKLAAYRATLDKPVSEMKAGELAAIVSRGNMQFFRQTGNRPARLTAEPDRGVSDPFEARIRKHMDAGAKSRGLAINRARRDSPKEYNEWMSKKHPAVQSMTQK